MGTTSRDPPLPCSPSQQLTLLLVRCAPAVRAHVEPLRSARSSARALADGRLAGRLPINVDLTDY